MWNQNRGSRGRDQSLRDMARGLLLLCGLILVDVGGDLMSGANGLTGSLLADNRSTELFRYTCSNRLARRDVTLFANGTVRLREGLWEEQDLLLDELLPEELQATLTQLHRLLISADPLAVGSIHGNSPTGGPQGDWVEDCEIILELPDEPSQSWQFTPLDIPPLVVSNLIQVAEDLADYTRPPAVAERVPADYRPQRGDVLVMADGERYRVLALTVDKRGVELEGIDSPLRIFVALDELANSFASVGEQGRR